MSIKPLFSIFKESSNSFDGQEKDETVSLLVRHHPFVILVELAFTIFLFFIPIFAGIFFYSFLSGNSLFELFLFIASLWYLILWQMLFYKLTMYTLDVWIVTDLRIVDSTQHGYFSRTTSELHLSRIQDMSVKIDGLIQTLFKFGDLEVQTAGTENKFKFTQVPHPNDVKDRIMGDVPANRNI